MRKPSKVYVYSPDDTTAAAPVATSAQRDTLVSEKRRKIDELTIDEELFSEGFGNTNPAIIEYTKSPRENPAEGDAVRTFESTYNLLGQIGLGAYSVVHRCQRKATGEVAISTYEY